MLQRMHELKIKLQQGRGADVLGEKEAYQEQWEEELRLLVRE